MTKKNISAQKVYQDFNYKLFKWSLPFSKAKSNHNKYLASIGQMRDLGNLEKDPTLYKAQEQLLLNNHQLYSGSSLRILIHYASLQHSPAFHSISDSWLNSLKHMGVICRPLHFSESLQTVCESFKPNVFLSLDDKSFSDFVDYDYLKLYKERNFLLIGNHTSINPNFNNDFDSKVIWAKKNSIDFFYSHRAEEYLNGIGEIKKFTDAGIGFLSSEFAADALKFYPIKRQKLDLDYVFFWVYKFL